MIASDSPEAALVEMSENSGSDSDLSDDSSLSDIFNAGDRSPTPYHGDMNRVPKEFDRMLSAMDVPTPDESNPMASALGSAPDLLADTEADENTAEALEVHDTQPVSPSDDILADEDDNGGSPDLDDLLAAAENNGTQLSDDQVQLAATRLLDDSDKDDAIETEDSEDESDDEGSSDLDDLLSAAEKRASEKPAPPKSDKKAPPAAKGNDAASELDSILGEMEFLDDEDDD